MIDDIAYQSNLYAVQRNTVLNAKSNEILGLIGINFVMGYHKLPSYEQFWSSAEDLGIPLVQRRMTKNRFEQILSMLQCTNTS